MKSKVAKTAFSVTVPIYYVRGGPGTGKSDFIRTHYKTGGVVIFPFSKLCADYTKDRIDPDGTTTRFVFKTTHRALVDLQSCDELYIDEFTSFNYEVAAILIYLLQPKRVLIADLRCSIQSTTITR